MSTFGGLSSLYGNFEYEFDSFESTTTSIAGESQLDTPHFQMGGKQILQGIEAIKITEVQIPFTWYVTDYYNNTFLLTETGHSPVTVTLPIGNYTITDFNTNLAAALTAVSPSSYTYTVVYNRNTVR